MASYQVTKELKFETEIKRGFSVKDLFTVFFPSVIAYYFADMMAHPTFVWPITILVAVLSLYATTRARSGNPDKRRYEAIFFYLQSDKGTYMALENPSMKVKAEQMEKNLEADNGPQI